MTDFNNTYAIFTYVCDRDVKVPAEVGVNIQDGFQEVFRYSSTPYTSLLACINNVRYYNLFYNLNTTGNYSEDNVYLCTFTVQTSVLAIF